MKEWRFMTAKFYLSCKVLFLTALMNANALASDTSNMCSRALDSADESFDVAFDLEKSTTTKQLNG